MSKKINYLYIIIIGVIFFVIFATYRKIFILHNYLISYEVSCDPKIESCFIVKCDQETGEGCNIGESEKYYKLINKMAFNSIKCAKDDTACLSCQKEEDDCKETVCNPSTDGECSDLIIKENGEL